MDSYFVIRNTEDFIGNKWIFQNIENAVQNIKNNDKLLLIGPSGIGKTLFIETVCNKYGYEIIKLDSSCCEHSNEFLDRLNKNHHWTNIMQSFQENTKKRIMIIDELETLIKIDRNIPSTLIKFWEKSNVSIPYIIIGQYDADKKIGELKKLCTVYNLQRIQDADMFLYLKQRLPKNKIKLADLMKIVEQSNGSLYAAIQSIKSYHKSHKQVVSFGMDKPLELKYIFQYTDIERIYLTIQNDPWIYPLKILENSYKIYPKMDYKFFLKYYMFFEEWMYKEHMLNDMPIGYLAQVIMYYNIQHSNTKNIDFQFTKLLSYISTKKKLQRSIYQKIPHNIPVSEIGVYWTHQYIINKSSKFSANELTEDD